MTKEEAKKEIEKLVERFREHRDEYHLAEYNEQKTRQDFVNPFFKALGWDMDNSGEASEAYREVIHEDRVKVHGKMKAPDYGFRLLGSGDKRLFFVEAKKPSVKLKVNKEPAFQIRRYGLSAQTPVSILTNFEEFVVYDCTKKPHFNDSANVARIKYISFEDYVKEFDFIYDTFSRDAVVKGRFDKFVKSDTYKKGSQTLDKYFVETLNGWRTWIATSIARNNLELTEDDINFVVQLTIDRLIFLRFCEDRGVEQYGQLQNAIKSGDVYHNLFDIFKQADDKYNSGLFDFEKDKISHNLTVDNKILKTIVGEMYYPQSSYDFRIMPVEIIGNAYEQFLGKVIRITPAHHAKIEDKPEVRKAGGVYYTPQYIVSYIVQNTVGKLIEGKSPKQIESIKIVDPACGSGSFLIGAFQFLLNYHTQWYTDHATAKAKAGKRDSPLTPDGKLTSAEKKKILLNNIYGVDIDSNAVEVTKLSLLLKCMEGETEASIKTQLSLMHERVLPDLDNNIKSGNSLIDTDFYDSEFELGFEKKIKPFNWQKGFPEVFKQGGFDAVIGNPPYVRQELLDNIHKEYYEKKYKVYHGIADLYSYFFEKGISLLKDKGLFGIIVANKWMRTNYGEPLRKWLKGQDLIEIIDFGDLPVFQNVTTYPCIVISGKGKVSKTLEVTNVRTLEFESLGEYIAQNKTSLEQSSLENESWNLGSDSEQKLLKKINSCGTPLSKYANGKIYRGIITGLNEAFVIDKETRDILIAEDSRSSKVIKPFLTGKDVKRYSLPVRNSYLILFQKGITNSSLKKNQKPINWLKEEYTAIYNHLSQYANDAEKRTDQGDYWWELRACDYYGEFEKEKIIYPNILKRPEFTFDSNGWYANQKCFIIPGNDKYLLGFLNSRLNHFLFEKYLPKLRGGFYEPSYVFFKNFPIKQIDFKNKSEVKSHDEIVKHVDLLLKLNAELPEAKLPEKIEQLKSRIAYSEDKINQLVYELYGLTEEEIKIVEGE